MMRRIAVACFFVVVLVMVLLMVAADWTFGAHFCGFG